jgi:hypothetical protein
VHCCRLQRRLDKEWAGLQQLVSGSRFGLRRGCLTSKLGRRHPIIVLPFHLVTPIIAFHPTTALCRSVKLLGQAGLTHARTACALFGREARACHILSTTTVPSLADLEMDSYAHSNRSKTLQKSLEVHIKSRTNRRLTIFHQFRYDNSRQHKTFSQSPQRYFSFPTPTAC